MTPDSFSPDAFMPDVTGLPAVERGLASGATVIVGAVRPTAEVQAELRRIVELDDTRMGQVYRALKRELTPEQIAAELGVSTSGFVWNYNQTIRSLLDGDLPAGATVALGVARKYRALLKRSDLSPASRIYLEANLAELDRRADDETALVAEVQRAHEQTQRAEARNDVGVYVYALPHYLRYPFDPSSGRTLMKVGRSDSDVIARFRNQTRTTALPEEPVLLRIYRTEGTSNAEAETQFHRLLGAADHHRSVARTAGREWFVTSTRFLDEVARALKLPLEVINDGGIDDV